MLEPAWKLEIREALEGYSKRVFDYGKCSLDGFFEPTGTERLFLVSEKLIAQVSFDFCAE